MNALVTPTPGQSALFRQVAELHPAIHTLTGEDVVLGMHPDHDERALSAVLRSLQSSHPTAGTRYWSTRLWLLLTWQPIYLCVAAVELNFSLNLSSLLQGAGRTSISGLTVDDPKLARDRRQALRHTATELRAYIDSTYQLVSQLIPLSRVNSYGLIADTLLNALVSAFEKRGRRKLLDLQAESRDWCQNAGLLNRHGQALSRIDSQCGHAGVVRCSCCRHHLTGASPSLYCTDCPLIKTDSERSPTRANPELTHINSTQGYSP